MSKEDEVEKSIEDLLKQLSNTEYDKVAKNPFHAESLASFTEEYLSPFITFGYDVNGDAVVISNATTQKDMDSIMISLGRYLSQQRQGDVRGDIGDIMGEGDSL